MIRRVTFCVGLLLATPVGGGQRAELPDLLQVVLLDRELLAIDAQSGGRTREQLHLGERVLWTEARGKVGVAVTDQRVLAVATQSGSWQEARYRLSETPPDKVWLGDRVALFVTEKRAIGFDGGSGNLVESSIGPHERVLHLVVGANVGLIVTARRALGLSPFRGGFFETKMNVGETIESVEALANHATITTSRRLLIFRATTGSFEVHRRGLGH